MADGEITEQELDAFLVELSPVLTHWQTQQANAVQMHATATDQLALLARAEGAIRRFWAVQEQQRETIRQGMALLETRDIIISNGTKEIRALEALRDSVAAKHPGSGTCDICKVAAPCPTRSDALAAYTAEKAKP